MPPLSTLMNKPTAPLIFDTPYGLVTVWQRGVTLIDEQHCQTPDRARILWECAIVTQNGIVTKKDVTRQCETFDHARANQRALETTPEGKAKVRESIARARREVLENLLRIE